MNTRANPDRRAILDRGVQSRNELLGAERRFRRSCEQIVLLNQRLDQLQVRYDMAKNSSNRAFRYNLRLKLAVVEGMRNVYYDYAHSKAKMVASLRRDLFGETVEIIADDNASDTSTDSIE